MSGKDRASYLQGLLTNDINALKAGEGCYAAYLTAQGRMIADLRVLELGDLALVDLDAAIADTVRTKLEQFVFTEDVQFSDLSHVLGAPAIFGPRGYTMLRRQDLLPAVVVDVVRRLLAS